MDSRPIKTERAESLTTTSSSVRGGSSPLKEAGKVLAAEVVGRGPRGEPLLQIGKQRVPVQSELPLKQGDRLQVRVEGTGESLSLRVVDTALSEAHGALRSLLARTHHQGDLAEAVIRLRTALEGKSGSSPESTSLLRALQSRVVRGELDGQSLAALMRRGGSSLEPRLLQVAVETEGPVPREETLRATTLQLLQAMTGGAELGRLAFDHFGALFMRTFQSVLASSSTPADVSGNARLERFLSSVLSEVLPVLAGRSARNATGVRLRARLVAALSNSTGHAALTGAIAPLLRKLLAESGPGDLKRLRAEIGEDLKTRLFQFLASAGPGEEADRATRLLEVLEQEQARNLARAEGDAGREWSLLFGPDENLTTLKIFRRNPHESSEASRSVHLTVGVEFSQLGPVRADLVLEGESLAVKLVVSEAGTLAQLHEQSRELHELLERFVPRVSLTLLQGPPEQVSVRSLELRIPFLDENHLLDLCA